MIKAIMVIWMGVGNTQTLAIDHFDSLAECETAKIAISQTGFGFLDITIPLDSIKCKPYANN